MDRNYSGVPGDVGSASPGGGEGRQEGERPERVERQLAQYAFMREERDREVRLLFRDVGAADIARTFAAAGATLITLAGERVALRPPVAAAEGEEPDHLAASDEGGTQRPRRKRRSTTAANQSGELLIRYFFSVGELVYTVGIVASTGVAESVAGVFPAAARSEAELRDRLAAIFT